MSNHLSEKGLKEVTKDISKSLQKKMSPEDQVKFHQSEWARLASFMQGRR